MKMLFSYNIYEISVTSAEISLRYNWIIAFFYYSKFQLIRNELY